MLNRLTPKQQEAAELFAKRYAAAALQRQLGIGRFLVVTGKLIFGALALYSFLVYFLVVAHAFLPPGRMGWETAMAILACTAILAVFCTTLYVVFIAAPRRMMVVTEAAWHIRTWADRTPE